MKKIQNKILEGARYVGNRFTVASETGHQHVIENVDVYENNGQTIIVVTKTTKLTHPQHGNVDIPPGIHNVRQVQDYLAGHRLD